MTKIIEAQEARTNLDKYLDLTEKGRTRFVVKRSGKPVAVILGLSDFIINIVKRPKVLAEIQKEASLKGIDKLTLAEIDEEISKYRQGK